jgi:hypothetical protein
MLDRFYQLVRVVRDSDETIAIVSNRAHKPQLMHAHVFHRAYCSADVDWILRFVKDDFYVRQARFSHPLP